MVMSGGQYELIRRQEASNYRSQSGLELDVKDHYNGSIRNVKTLSGGESQRVKLSSELSKRDTGKTIYILDEPTTGLHFEDIRILMDVLNKLVDKGNTVIVIEHNLDVIKMADYIVDMGPEGGKGGGHIVAQGTPEEVAVSGKGYTSEYLKVELEQA
jgi:excinuclease ABC subunit A